MEQILCCPRGYRQKGEAQAALEKEVAKSKQSGSAPGWKWLRLYFCSECRQYHIWPRRPPRKLERQEVEVATEQLMENFDERKHGNNGREQQHPLQIPAPAGQ